MWVVALLATTLLASVRATAAVSPTPTVVPGGDTRSEGEGPGLSASPLLVAAGVVVIGLASAASTLLYLRLRRDD